MDISLKYSHTDFGTYKYAYRSCKISDAEDMGLELNEVMKKSVGLMLCPDVSMKDKRFIMTTLNFEKFAYFKLVIA